MDDCFKNRGVSSSLEEGCGVEGMVERASEPFGQHSQCLWHLSVTVSEEHACRRELIWVFVWMK